MAAAPKNKPQPSIFQSKGFQSGLKYLTLFSAAIAILGLLFLTQDLVGHNEMLIVGLSSLSMACFMMAFQPLPEDLPEDKRQLFVIAKTLGSVGAAVGCIAALFVFLLFPGAKALTLTGGVGSLATLLFALYPPFRPYNQLRNPGLLMGALLGVAVWLTPPAAQYSATHPSAEKREVMLYEAFFHNKPDAERIFFEFKLEQFKKNPDKNRGKIRQTEARLQRLKNQ